MFQQVHPPEDLACIQHSRVNDNLRRGGRLPIAEHLHQPEMKCQVLKDGGGETIQTSGIDSVDDCFRSKPVIRFEEELESQAQTAAPSLEREAFVNKPGMPGAQPLTNRPAVFRKRL